MNSFTARPGNKSRSGMKIDGVKWDIRLFVGKHLMFRYWTLVFTETEMS